jgi:hypothetical protein
MKHLYVIAAATLLLAGCGSTTNRPASPNNWASPAATAPTSAPAAPPATPAVAHGVARVIGDVPWTQVGPGWTLAVWTPLTPHRPGEQRAPGEADPETATSVLYLVSPAGDRYSITEFPPEDNAPRLIDWSGDGSHALFEITKDRKEYALSIELHTGDRTTTPISGTPRYTRPDGKALLLSTDFNGNEPGTLERIGMDGTLQLAYPTDDLGGAGQFSGDYLPSPDGTQLVLGTANLGNEIVPRSDNSLVILGNDGSIIKTLPAPMPKAYCAPVKWWAPTVVLAHCDAEAGSGEQLWKVPLDGGTPTALTALNSAQGHDPGFEGNFGNWTAFETPSGTFLPTGGACGTTFVSRLTADGHTTRIKIPGVRGSVGLAGVIGDKLALVAEVGCGGGESLIAYDPAANTSTVLLGPPAIGGGVDQVRPYPDDK